MSLRASWRTELELAEQRRAETPAVDDGRARVRHAWIRKPVCSECHGFIVAPTDAALVIYSPDEQQDQLAHRAHCFVKAVIRFNEAFNARAAAERARRVAP